MEALFRAYFTEGRDFGHTPTLLDVAAALNTRSPQPRLSVEPKPGSQGSVASAYWQVESTDLSV